MTRLWALVVTLNYGTPLAHEVTIAHQLTLPGCNALAFKQLGKWPPPVSVECRPDKTWEA